MSEPREVWAFMTPCGWIVAGSGFEIAEDAWRFGLGFGPRAPKVEEVMTALDKGYRVAKVRVTEVEE
jgi:hypothetical protein